MGRAHIDGTCSMLDLYLRVRPRQANDSRDATPLMK